VTINDLLDRWTGNDGADGNARDKCEPSREWSELRAKTVRMYTSCIKYYIRPKFGPRKAAEIKRSEIAAWHQWICEDGFQGSGKRPPGAAPGQVFQPHRRIPSMANRAKATLSRLYNLAIEEWELLTHNPCKKVKKYDEEERERYLVPDEKERLITAATDLKRDPYATWHTRQHCIIILTPGRGLRHAQGSAS
jgi:hypothetical protein